MQPARLLILITSACLVVLFAVNYSLSSVTSSARSLGCPPLADSGASDPTDTVAFWMDQALVPPLALAASLTADQQQVLGTSTTADKWVEVDLAKQMLFAHQGTTIVFQSPISSGLWNKTPPGEYHIWYKIRSTKMEGGSKLNHTYYYLPNVPYAMFFSGDYGIHGTYWHNNFGQPMSHGCVNAPTPIAEKLFYWTDPQLPAGKLAIKATSEQPGTLVVIHE